MLSAREIADFAVASAHDAVDRVISFIQTDPPSFEDWTEPETALIEARQSTDRNVLDRGTWEHHAASMMLTAVRYELGQSESDVDDEVPDPDAGYLLLRDGDLEGVLALTDALLQEAASTSPDNWNHGNLLHHAHVLRGKVFFAQGDVSASAVELLAAGGVSGSPQLDSFGPDLSLAWSLLNSDQDQAVVAYLKGIARFWSPRDPADR
jgi:hypothetical protein